MCMFDYVTTFVMKMKLCDLLLQFGFNMFPHEIPRNFSTDYKCYSVSMMPGQERQDVEQGGKSMLFSFIIIIIIIIIIAKTSKASLTGAQGSVQYMDIHKKPKVIC